MADELRLKVARALGYEWFHVRRGRGAFNFLARPRDVETASPLSGVEAGRDETMPDADNAEHADLPIPDWPNDPGAAARDVLGEIERRQWQATAALESSGRWRWAIFPNAKPHLSSHGLGAFAMALCLAFVAAVEAQERKDGA